MTKTEFDKLEIGTKLKIQVGELSEGVRVTGYVVEKLEPSGFDFRARIHISNNLKDPQKGFNVVAPYQYFEFTE